MTHDTGWFKSSYSGSDANSCVEVRIIASQGVSIRDSKAPKAKVLRSTSAAWSTFVRATAR
jgi:hypothetical protein